MEKLVTVMEKLAYRHGETSLPSWKTGLPFGYICRGRLWLPFTASTNNNDTDSTANETQKRTKEVPDKHKRNG